MMCSSLVGLVEVHDFFLKFLGLVGSKTKLADIVRAVFIRIIIS